MVKITPATSSDQSYFASPSTYSTIQVITPSPINTTPPQHTTEPPPVQESEMLHRLATFFPPPPTLSLSALRYCAPEQRVPQISTSHRSQTTPAQETMPSPMDRSRRSPTPAHSPTMDVSSSPSKHTLHVQLPLTIQPEMITISVNRGDKLKVVADAWHMENDCHYEWQITFPPRDIDMTTVQAKFEEGGHLYIDVRRL